jgi:hypothetical protein
MKQVNLFGYPYPLLIIPCQSGMFITTQAGGLHCKHPSIEGIILPVPFAQYEPFNDQLEKFKDAMELDANPGCGDIYTSSDVTIEEADRTDAVFEKHQVPLKVNRDKLNESMEAWLYVHLQEGECDADDIIKDFVGQEAILTWENCD